MESQGYQKHCRHLVLWVVLSLQLLATTFGCQSTNNILRDDASFCKYGICLKDGATTKDDASFYTRHLNLCYKSKDDKVYIYALPDVGAVDLVLIFGEDGLLKRHAFARGIYGY
jgi:hypothetical protein